MRITQLDLSDFRNYTSLSLPLGEGLTVVVGANGQGKTNLLEAVMVASRFKSPRTDQLRETIRWEAESAGIHVVTDDGRPGRVDVVIGDRGPRVRVNGKAPRRRNDAVGALLAVLFTPDDLRLVKDEPERRRAFMDGLLGLVRPAAAGSPAEYARVVRQRNALLKQVREGSGARRHLDAWDAQLVHHGSALAIARAELVDALAVEAEHKHRELCGEDVSIDYGSDTLSQGREPEAAADHLRRRLAERREDEIARGVSLVGPHRDDMVVTLGGVSAREFASQGQQRTVVLALKLAELALTREARGEPPVLLLDDVMSELDRARRRALAHAVGGLDQAIITTTTPEYFAGLVDAPTRWLRLEAGSMEEEVA